MESDALEFEICINPQEAKSIENMSPSRDHSGHKRQIETKINNHDSECRDSRAKKVIYY